MRDMDISEYAFRNGYDKALDEFIEITTGALERYLKRSSNDDFQWGAREGITECLKVAKKLKDKNNGEKHTENI